MADALAALSRIGLVPVITIGSPRDAVPLAEALLDGGIGCAEVTFRTPSAGGGIPALSSTCGELLVGAGAGAAKQEGPRAHPRRAPGARWPPSCSPPSALLPATP